MKHYFYNFYDRYSRTRLMQENLFKQTDFLYDNKENLFFVEI